MTRALWLATILALLGVTVCVARAFGQDDTVRVLAQSCVAEASWLERDCRAIMHVLKRRADRAGVPVADHARDYVSAFKTQLPARRWVLELEPTCDQPPSWPANLDWEAQRVQCELLFERVEAFVAGESVDPCPRAMHWGARDLAPDVERAARAPWRVVDCGKTANVFFAERRVSASEAKGRK